MVPETQIAKSYDLNILASITGRCSARVKGATTNRQIREVHAAITEVLDRKDKPIIPHSDPEAARQLLEFVSKIEQQHRSTEVKEVIPDTQQVEVQRVLADIKQECNSLIKNNGQREFWCSPESIANFFGFPTMWHDGTSTVRDEFVRWSATQRHPDVSEALKITVDQRETRRLLEHVAHEVLDLPLAGDEDIYVGNNQDNYHLFWSVTADGIDYFTPAAYDLATQLSFDVPHNVAHLAHLNAVKDKGVHGYLDDIERRTYFEAVAVLSEWQLVRKIKDGSYTAAQMLQELNPTRVITGEHLNEWIVADRTYEFRLRNARLLGDILTVQGASFDEAVAEVQREGNIPKDAARGEVRKYYAWTGLNSIYTLGYRRLIHEGVNSVKEAIFKSNGQPRTSWGIN